MDMFENIMSLDTVDSVKKLTEQHSDVYLVRKYWDAYKVALSTKDPLDKAKALAICRYINLLYASSIPVSPRIKRFLAPHGFRGIFISLYAKLGRGCTIFQNVTIGSNALPDSKSAGFPTLGDNVFVGAGATIVGNVRIGNNVRIGAGCFVSRDVEDNCTVVQGAPVVIHKNKPNVNKLLSPAELARRLSALPENDFPPKMDTVEKTRMDKAFRLLFVGDLILLEDQVKLAYNNKKYDFSSLFEYTKKYISSADFSVGVFEGPLGGENSSYSTSNFADGKLLKLSFPDEFADAVKEAGFDLVTTANNHLLDKGIDGMRRTVRVLDEKGIPQIGSYVNGDDKEKRRIKVVNAGEIRLAFLSYTYGANYHSSEVLFKESSYVTSVILPTDSPDYDECKQQVEQDFSLAKSYNPDLIVVLPHWGTQFVNDPSPFQEAWRKNFLSWGASIILGDHTHSIQPIKMEKVCGRNTFTLYCPGNYTNIYREHNGDASAIVEVNIDRESKEIIGGSIVPMWIHSTCDGNFRPVPVYDIMENPLLKQKYTTDDIDRVDTVLKHISRIMLKRELDSHSLQEKYSFTENGFKRDRALQLNIDDCMKKGIAYQAISKATDVCFIGDSITEGTKNGGVPWYEPIEQLVRGEIGNVSIGGATTGTLLCQEFLDRILHRKYDLYVIAIGTNDVRYRNPRICAMTEDVYVERLRKLMRMITEKYPDSCFLFISPWTSTDGDKISMLKYKNKMDMNRKYAKSLKSLAEKCHAFYVDPTPYIEMCFRNEPHRKYLVDWIHPNATRGVQLYSRAVLLS